MLRASHSADTLVIAYPGWVGLLLLAFGVALAAYIVRAKPSRNLLGLVVAALLLFAGGWHFLWFRVSLGADAAEQRSAFGTSARLAWSSVDKVRVERRSSGRGGHSSNFVLRSDSGEELVIPTTGMGDDDLGAVVAVLRARGKLD